MSFFRLHPFSRHRHHSPFWIVYALAVVFNFHSLLVAYTNSSYVGNYISASGLSLIYSAGSAISVIAFLLMNNWLRKFGNVRLTLILGIIEIASLLVMGFAPGVTLLMFAFLIFLVINPLLFLSIDIFSETLIGNNEGSTGSKRGLTLALMSAASVCGPLALSIIVGSDDTLLYRTYFVSAAFFMSFIAIMMIFFRKFEDPTYPSMNIRLAFQKSWHSKAIKQVCAVHFSLQLFFSWMVIYVPLYLTTVLNFSWEQVGSIIAVGLFAYVIFEYPTGLLADKLFGEKEMMAIGMLIIIISTASISFMPSGTVLGWMILMFASRIGASLVEVTTESYFFKHTNGSDTHSISFFRLLRPLSMIAGSILGAITLYLLPISLAFLILAIVLIPCLFSIQYLVDTK